MTAVKDAIDAMVAAIPEITINDETNEFNDKEFKDEYEKIHRDVEEYRPYYQSTQYVTCVLSLSYQKRVSVR